mmetsp:Transcript_16520/g.64492  ORF Transcript_16520/g.64492 Transcript_16520/m.64492 type:complete len:321 (+) Transcript_16520:346-1308(+)
MEQGSAAVAFFRQEEDKNEEEERRTAAAMEQARELKAAAAAHAQCQAAITTVGDSEVEEAINQRNTVRKRLLDAGAAACGAGDAIQRHLRTLERRRTAASTTLEALRSGGKKETRARTAVDEAYVAGVEELIGRVQTAAKAAHSAVTDIRKEDLKRVEECANVSTAADEEERTRHKAALESSRALLAELADVTCLLRSTAAEAAAVAAKQCADWLAMISMEEAHVRHQLDAYTKVMDALPALRQSTCPSWSPSAERERREAIAQEDWSIAASSLDLAQKRMKSAKARDSPLPQREKAAKTVAKRQFEAEERALSARKRVR